MATIARFAVFGPFANTIDRTVIQSCRRHWWVDILYVGNFVQPDVCPKGRVFFPLLYCKQKHIEVVVVASCLDTHEDVNILHAMKTIEYNNNVFTKRN